MKWITIWILSNTLLTTLTLIYFYLNKELEIYGILTMILGSLSIVLPYTIWKYNQIKFVEKNNIVIQILND